MATNMVGFFSRLQNMHVYTRVGQCDIAQRLSKLLPMWVPEGYPLGCYMMSLVVENNVGTKKQMKKQFWWLKRLKI